jgi:hypothetical protein
MSVGDVAGLIAAIAFVLLVGFLALPLVKLGRVLDEARVSVKSLTDHTVPVLDEAASALTSLFAATVGSPMIKVAAFSYGVRRALSGLRASARASRSKR